MNKFREDPLRVLAKSYYWQALYNRAKALPGCIELFENKKDFSVIQMLFLQYVEQIAGLYQDLAMKEKLLCEEVINDEIRATAYLVYKNKHREDNITNNNPVGDKLICIPRKKAK